MKKSFCVIGDIHGRNDWKEIAITALTKFQHVIFVGDYLDSFDIKASNILYNFNEIIEFKKANFDKVTLLIGNHDFSYYMDEIGISGFNHNMWPAYKKILKDNIDLFDVAYGYENWKTKKYTLFSHAGLTYGYYKNVILPRLDGTLDNSGSFAGADINTPLHQILNRMKFDRLLWKVGSARGGSGTPGPLWADYSELLEDPYPMINQVFGHTASGTVNVNQFDDCLIAKVDGWYNKKLAHLVLNI
jgi:hypothetical protein